MAWSFLPEELGDLILSKMSLHELGRISTASRAFHAAFKRLLAAQQKARCKLAVDHFWRRTILCIASLINRFLTRDPELACSSGATDFRIDTEGTFQAVGQSKRRTRWKRFHRQYLHQDIAMPEILGSFSFMWQDDTVSVVRFVAECLDILQSTVTASHQP
jgi:hypothetical protein